MSDVLELLLGLANGVHDDLDVAAEAVNEIIDLEQEIARLRAETARLRGNLADCAERAAYWKDRAEFSEDQLAQIAAHEKCCAGKWVKVTERLPEPRRVVSTRTADNSWMPSNWIEGGAWRVEHNRVVEWLDARMPGEER